MPPLPPWDDDLLDDDLLADEDEEWVGLGEEGRPGFRAALFSSQAAHYARFRPFYPPHVSCCPCCLLRWVLCLAWTAVLRRPA